MLSYRIGRTIDYDSVARVRLKSHEQSPSLKHHHPPSEGGFHYIKILDCKKTGLSGTRFICPMNLL